MAFCFGGRGFGGVGVSGACVGVGVGVDVSGDGRIGGCCMKAPTTLLDVCYLLVLVKESGWHLLLISAIANCCCFILFCCLSAL